MEDTTKRFLDLAVDRGFVTRAQVDECLKLRESFREVGVDQKVEDLLVKKGYLGEEAAGRLRRELSGMRVGKYRTLERLGEGGAGVVYKAVQEPLERVVAIKLLSSARAGSPEYLERFQREARIAVTLNHQNIVRGLDYGQADGYHYFVMEFVEGESLKRVIGREGMIEEKRAFRIALMAVEGLRHAAGFNLVHRDIKPENILLAADGVAKVCDLGLAKPSMLETAQAVKDGQTIGTPLYMSPEQILGQQEADFRSDVYSLGVTLYEMVTGQRPFSGQTVDEIVRKHLREPPADPRELNIKLSPSAATVILKMLLKKPEERYASLDDLREDLQAVVDGRPPRHAIQIGRRKPAGAARVDLDEHRPRLAPGRRRSPLLLVLGAVAVGGAAAAFVILSPFGKGPATPTPGPTPGPEVPGPTVPDPAEALLAEAVEYLRANPEASFEAKVERLALVIEKHPATRYALDAKERIRALTAERDAAAAQRKDAARRAFDGLQQEAARLAGEMRYADAAAVFGRYPSEYADTEYPEKARREASRLLAEAEEKAKAAIEDADTRMRRGDFAGAEAALDPLARMGIPGIADRAGQKREEIRAARAVEAEAREEGEALFRSVVGAAFARAARGEDEGAEEDLVRAGEEAKLAAFRQDLDDAFRDLREVGRFRSALMSGARKLVDRAEEFVLLNPAGAKTAGKITAADADGLRLLRGTKEEVVAFANLSPPDRLRLAFLALELGRGEDHRAAALHFICYGLFEAAEAEIEAARVAGLDVAPIRVRRDMIVAYARERADAEIRKAEILTSQKRLAEARDTLASAVLLAPGYARLRFALGSVLLDLGKSAEAVPELRRAQELGYDDPVLHYRIGWALADLLRPEEAVAELERFRASAPAGHPDLPSAEKMLGNLRESALSGKMKALEDQMKTAFRRKDYEKAVSLGADLLRLNPAHEEALLHVARGRLEQGQILAGYLALREALAAVPAGKKAPEFKRLLRALEKDHSANPRSLELNQKGMIEFESGGYAVAVTAFSQAIEESRLNAEAYYNRARAHTRIGEMNKDAKAYAAAKEDYVAAAGIRPEMGEAKEGLATVCYYLGEYEDALDYAREGILALPNRWQSMNIAGLIFHVRGEYSTALEFFDRGLKVAPDEVTLLVNKALALEGLGRKDEAADALRTATKKTPTEAQLRQINEIMKRLIE